MLIDNSKGKEKRERSVFTEVTKNRFVEESLLFTPESRANQNTMPSGPTHGLNGL